MIQSGSPKEKASALKVMLDVTKQLSDLIGLKPPDVVSPMSEEDLTRAESLVTNLLEAR